MKRIVLFVLSVLFVLCVVSPVSPVAHAQDATPEATPAVVTVNVPGTTINVEQPAAPAADAPWLDLSKSAPFLAVIVLLCVLLAFSTIRHDKLAVVAANSIPASLWPAIRAGLVQGANDVGAYVGGTPTPLDDAVYTPTRSEFDDLIARMDALEAAKSAAQVTVNNNAAPTPDSGSNSG